MNEEVKTIRNNIVRKFCRTVLWIDDEIHLDQGLAAKGTPALFQNKFDEFTRSGLLCHMMGFPEIRPGSDPFTPQSKLDEVLGTCVSLALQSDVVIVDWMLGTTDSSEYAENIVKHILGKDKGFRFIVVLSNKEIAESEFIKIDSSFKIHGSGDLLKNESGQFLLSLQKNDFIGAKLTDKICQTLLTMYPDYLHLTALEIAGRIKDITPRWLSDIPFCTDIGVLVERGNTYDEAGSWNDEIQDCIATNLLEDLSCAVRVEKLDTLNAEALKPSNSAEYEKIASLKPSGPDDFKQAINALKECVKDDSPKSFSKGHYEKMSDNRENGDGKILVESIEAFAEFCEKRSRRDWQQHGPCPGAVYVGLVDKSQAIAVCITSGCDCLRADTLLFLIGEPMSSKNSSGATIPNYKELRNKKRKTVLRINGVSYVFKSSADSVLTKRRSDLEMLQVQAIVRQDALNRLIDRYMSHTQRYGVNQPDIVRELRGEGGLD